MDCCCVCTQRIDVGSGNSGTAIRAQRFIYVDFARLIVDVAGWISFDWRAVVDEMFPTDAGDAAVAVASRLI